MTRSPSATPPVAATGGLPAAIRRSLTWDYGAEMARHATITATGLPVYFAHALAVGTRQQREPLNRIFREFFPKGVTITSDPRLFGDGESAAAFSSGQSCTPLNHPIWRGSR